MLMSTEILQNNQDSNSGNYKLLEQEENHTHRECNAM